MIRTQIYITPEERGALSELSEQTGKSQSELIREAIDHFCRLHQPKTRLEKLQQAKGMWHGREDLSKFDKLRSSFDRKRQDDK